MIKKLIIILVVVLGLIDYSLAGNKVAVIISAHVLPKLTQRVLHQETKLYVSEMDIERGYIEVFSGTILQISTNDKGGYGLFFEGYEEFLKEVWVMEKGRRTVISSDGGFVYQPYSGEKVEVKAISYRLFLKENIQPGLYPFPLKVRASLI